MSSAQRLVAKPESNIKNFSIALILALFFDQLSKIIISNYLSPVDPPLEVIGSLLRFKLAYNPYGVFSITYGPSFLYYAFHIIGVFIFSYIGLTQKDGFRTIVFGFIVGGALGNLLDRIRLKYVIDFIDMGIGDLRWFTYNLADAFVTLGAIYLIASELFAPKKS